MHSKSLCLWSFLLPVFVAAMVSGAPGAGVRQRQRVLLVSLDGFRWDYLNRKLTPSFNQFREKGVYADHVVPTFTTKTFPCHTSIITGRYQEHHGMVGNSMFDPTTNKTFNMGTKDPFWWDYNNSLPLWISAVKAGLRSGVYFWPGSEVPRKGLSATAWFNYSGSTTLQTKFNQVINWLQAGYELVVLYHNQPDAIGHDSGPNTDETNDVLTWLDEQFSDFFSQLEQKFNDVNIIITADHGMTDIVDSIILRNYNITDKDIRIVESGPILQAFYAAGADEQTVFNKLNQVKLWQLYRKQDIPERLHFRDNPRIPSILAIANEGYQITRSAQTNLMGNHGFDNEISRMWTIFMARGPAFKKGYKHNGGIEQVDIYPLICGLLNIPCEPHDGDLRRVQDLLASGSTPQISTSTTTTTSTSTSTTTTKYTTAGSSALYSSTSALLSLITITLVTLFFIF